MERIPRPEVPGLALEIDPANQSSFGPCECCGETTLCVWGYVYRDDAAFAVYYVEWTPGHPHRDATFDLIIGRWGEGAEATYRKAVSLGFRNIETGPAFMVQNASVRQVASSSLVSEALDREQVLGTPLTEDAFALCDIIYLGDPRIEELRTHGWMTDRCRNLGSPQISLHWTYSLRPSQTARHTNPFSIPCESGYQQNPVCE